MKSLNSSQQSKQVAQLAQETGAITPTQSKSDISKPTPTQRHLPPKWGLGVGVLLGGIMIASGIYAYRWWQYNQQYGQKYQTTDDAYVSANIQSVTSRISGVVTEVSFDENQVVFPGMTLVRLDSSNYQVSLAQAKASLELARQQAVLAQKKLDISAHTLLPEPVPVNQRNTKVARTGINRDKMLQVQAINQLQYKTALAAIAQKQADVQKAELQLSYSNITALIGGKVSEKNVQIGQFVQPGQTLVKIVQPHPWITANFRETQIEKIQPGLKVDIKIPAFPSQHFQGKVESISPTAVDKSALQPQEHTKDSSTRSDHVQRIPVKIVFDPQSLRGYESRITPGMSATAVVHF